MKCQEHFQFPVRSVLVLTNAVDAADVAPDVASPADLSFLRTARPEYRRHPSQDGLSSDGSLVGSVSSPVVIPPVLSLDTSLLSLLLLGVVVSDPEVCSGSDQFPL